ncbi:hypothetical protein [Sessilibacter corallicola]|uniref:DUF4468 domain-containing protein n=1 Tax=Sessilibacter corallicola TaxID=2904075 RepID=A0ABQ0A4F1_9GAMM
MKYYRYKLIFLSPIIILMASCDSKFQNCKSLVTSINDPEIYQNISSWINDELEQKLENIEYETTAGVYPGDYKILNPKLSFDVLGMNPDYAAIRLVVNKREKNLKITNINYISIAEVSRRSILYKINSEVEYEKFEGEIEISKLSSDFAAYCYNSTK